MRQLRVAPHRRHVHRGHRRHELLDTDIDIGQGLAGGILHGHLKGAFARGWRIWLRAKRDVHTRAPRRRGCRGGRSLVVLKASAELALGIEEEVALVATCWPSLRPSRISVRSARCRPVLTVRGVNAPSPAEMNTICRVPESSTAFAGTVNAVPPPPRSCTFAYMPGFRRPRSFGN